MGAVALECILDRDEAGARRLAPGRFQIVADMGEKNGVDAVEHAVTDHEGLAGDQLFGDAGPEQQGAGDVLLLHQLLDRQGGDDVDRLARIVALAMRSEEHTSELQSLMRISYAVFCLKKKK